IAYSATTSAPAWVTPVPEQYNAAPTGFVHAPRRHLPTPEPSLDARKRCRDALYAFAGATEGGHRSAPPATFAPDRDQSTPNRITYTAAGVAAAPAAIA